MKKYLMSGVAAIAFLAAFTSCSKSTDLYEGPKPEPVVEKPAVKSDTEKLTDSFEKVIGGSINPNTDWGFGSAAMTRAFTRGVDKNTNQYATYVEVPDKLTDAQKAKVRNWFQSHPTPDGISVNWSDFFVQQVYKGKTTPTATCPEEYTSKAGNSVVGSDKMNKLTCGNNNEHVNDFNSGNRSNSNVAYKLGPNYNPINNQNDLLYHDDQITFMVGSSTECFGFHNSESSEQRNDKFVIIPGDDIQKWDSSTIVDGENADVSGMYFVGLDFAANGSSANMQVDADGYYSDWIVKITPGLYRDSKTYRIMCEDLFATDLSKIDDSDWDFNDVVFDARKDGEQTIIILYAAGGTLPLTIDGVEVHGAFKVETGIMVNTENGTVDKPVAIFRLNKTFANANEITVVADGKTLTAETGKVPMKLCVPTGTKWLKEKVIITEGYPQFATYATTKEPEDWYKTIGNSGALVSK